MESEAIRGLGLFVRALEALEIPYFVGGSFASSFHGLPRSTQDADLVADLALEHVSPLIAHLGKGFYLDDERLSSAIRTRSSFNALHLPTMFKIDVFLLSDDPLARQEMERRQRHHLGEGVDAYFASAEDTVLQKLRWYQLGNRVSERQWNDLLGVLRVQGDRLDRGYLDWGAGHLGVEELLAEALEAAGG